MDSFRHFYPEQKKYSFWSAIKNSRPIDKGWRIDYFMVSNSFMKYIADSTIHNEYYGSDHCPIQLKVDLSTKTCGELGKPKKEESEEINRIVGTVTMDDMFKKVKKPAN